MDLSHLNLQLLHQLGVAPLLPFLLRGVGRDQHQSCVDPLKDHVGGLWGGGGGGGGVVAILFRRGGGSVIRG